MVKRYPTKSGLTHDSAKGIAQVTDVKPNHRMQATAGGLGGDSRARRAFARRA
jgi:hypothetical protein